MRDPEPILHSRPPPPLPPWCAMCMHTNQAEVSPAIFQDVHCGGVPVQAADTLAGWASHHHINVSYRITATSRMSSCHANHMQQENSTVSELLADCPLEPITACTVVLLSLLHLRCSHGILGSAMMGVANALDQELTEPERPRETMP